MHSLDQFLIDLWDSGKVEVSHEIIPFSSTDLENAQVTLSRQEIYLRQEFPGIAPAFDPAAALWAAQFIYRSIQLILLRHLEEHKITELLQGWPGYQNPSTIYSADMCLQHLPMILAFAKRLSPDDPLVLTLTNIASLWPFSGLGLAEADPQSEIVLLSHPALTQAYVDRIIAKRLYNKAHQENIQPLVAAVLGIHAAQFWPEWNHSSQL